MDRMRILVIFVICNSLFVLFLNKVIPGNTPHRDFGEYSQIMGGIGIPFLHVCQRDRLIKNCVQKWEW